MDIHYGLDLYGSLTFFFSLERLFQICPYLIKFIYYLLTINSFRKLNVSHLHSIPQNSL